MGSLEGGLRVEGGGHCQLWPKDVKLFSDIRVAEMVRRWVICTPKRCARCPSRGTGLSGGNTENGGNTDRRSPHTVEGTAIRKRGRSCDGAGGLWAI